MGKQVNVTIYIDEDVVKKAKELGLNISKTCENALKMAIERLSTLYEKSETEIRSKCGGWDLNSP